MFTLENTKGFTQAELNKMNWEVEDQMITAYHCYSLSEARIWAEDKILDRWMRIKNVNL